MSGRHSTEMPRIPLAARIRLRPVQSQAAFLVGGGLLVWLAVAAALMSPIVAAGAIGVAALALLVLVSALSQRGAVGVGPGALEKAATTVITVAMFFAPLNAIRPIQAVSLVTLADLLFVVGFALLAPVLVNRKLVIPRSYQIGWVLLLTTGLLASAAADSPLASLNGFLRLVTAALVLPVAFLWWRPDRSVIGRLAAAYVIGAAVSVAAAVINGPPASGERPVGLTTHENWFGHASLIGLCLLLFVVTQVPVQRRWVYYGLGAVCVYGIWISGSRGSLVALIGVILIYPFIERSLLAAGGLLLGLAATVLFWNQIADQRGDNALARLLGSPTGQTSDAIRADALGEAIEAFLARPLIGTGYENALAAHNIFVEMAKAAGIVGLLGFLLMLWALVSPLLTAPRPYHRLGFPVLAYILLGPLTTSLWDRLIWAGMTLAMLATAVEKKDSPEPEPTTSTVHQGTVTSGSLQAFT